MIDFAHGVGVNLTPEFYGQVMTERAVPYDFLEVDPTLFDLSEDVRATFSALALVYPIVLHSTTMSLCGDAPLDLGQLSKIADFAQTVGSQVYSDHLSFTWAGDINLDLYMTPLFSDEMLDWVSLRARAIESVTLLPFVAENVGMMISQQESDHSETEFLRIINAERGVPIQLNLDSVSVSAATLGLDPREYVQEFLFENIETIAVVQEASMNSGLRKTYGSGIDAMTLAMLDTVLGGSDVQRVQVQRRSGEQDPGFDSFYMAVRDLYAKHRGAV